MAGINKEIWISEILEGFYPDGSFLSEPSDLSAFVEYNTINLADAGADPNVLINNTTYPIPVNTRTDIPHAIPLDTFDTENTVVRNIEEIESAYDKLASVVRQHKNSLLATASKKAAHAYAPNADSVYTPVLPASGSSGSKIKLDDIITLRNRFDKVNMPNQGRVLVLHPDHFAQLQKEDMLLFKGFMQNDPGFNLFGFKVYVYSDTPKYDKTNGTKLPYGASSANETISSVTFVNSEVMKAMGTIEMFAIQNDPQVRGDIIGFQMRFIAMPKRNKCIGAIYTP